KQKWLNELNKIFIKASEREKEIFYTSLYHTFLSPVTYSDVDGKYRGVDNNIHQSNDFTNYTIFSLWDTYRATHPLFTITQEKRVNDMIKSMLAHYEQSIDGILPIWSFHANENWCMIGYHAVSVIADAYVKGIRDYDTEKAWQAVKASSTYKDYDGLNYYMNKGFIPGDKESESVSKVLEYAYDDYAISQMAKAMVKKTDYDNYIERAQNYRNLYHEKTKFLRAKNTDGSWKEPFDPLHVSYYDADYTEGNAWQYTWYVPQDVMGLISLMGGENEFVLKLDSLFALEDVENKHLEVEDISGLIGQYAHGNEPSQHIAYLYNWAKQPWRTQERIHQIMNNLFDNTPDGICGNEDCGQMSSWYIFSSMGFYPVAPGSNQYIIGSPCIKEARIQLKDKNEFVIKAPKLNKENIYIQSLILNGEKINRSYIYHDEIMQGGELIFNMGNVPNKKWAVQNSSLPFSISE
ncbi:MAG: glycoside hydrolase family 92 protein, partial [Bacteroidota bacterium]|nr:glycoside hydrolase family 92 protein [Bacteroidota bacterium]